MSKTNKQKAYKSGIFAELIVMFWYFLKGYRLLKWRHKTPLGEIDLIMKRRNTIHFIEVKKRKTLNEAAFCFMPQQKKRILNAANLFLAKNSYQNTQIHYILACVNKKYRSQFIKIIV
jgi:putative endonuclease